MALGRACAVHSKPKNHECTRCKDFGLVSVSKDPDIDEPCDCPQGTRWMQPWERSLRALYDLKEDA